jgi:antitoxin VapB
VKKVKKVKTKKPMMVREVAVLPEAPEADMAKLFWNGRSQAVRLPKAFRFEGDAVHIRRSGDAVILEPLRRRGWPAGFWEWIDASPKDWLDKVERLDVRLRDRPLDAV